MDVIVSTFFEKKKWLIKKEGEKKNISRFFFGEVEEFKNPASGIRENFSKVFGGCGSD